MGYQFLGLLGWITAISFGFAVLNFFLKYANKHYIIKLDKSKSKIANYYQIIMKLIVKNHKVFGILAASTAILHVLIAIVNGRIRISGIVAIALLGAMVGFGIYGAYFNKNYKGKWLKFHRAIALTSIFVIVFHILIKSV